MRGSFQIAKFFGIPVFVHWSFGLIFAWIFYLGYSNEWNWSSIGVAVAFVLALFVCVVMHEFGHALTARRYGVKTRDIILSPIGGVARLDRLPEKPMQEFYVAIAGPLVNVGIIFLLLPYLLFVSEETRAEFLSLFRGYFGVRDNVFIRTMTPVDVLLFGLIMMNVVLAGFNLLPAFPMDGGRVLRALLSIRLGRARATQIAATIGQLFAILIIAYGFGVRFGFDTGFFFKSDPNWMVMLVGGFVFMMATNEKRNVRAESLLENRTVADVVRTEFTRFSLQDSMQQVVEVLRRGAEKHFLVFDENQQLKGILWQEDILKIVKDDNFNTSVEHVYDLDYKPLTLKDNLRKAHNLAQWENYEMCPVYNEVGEIVGVLDAETLYHFLRTQLKGGR